MATTTVDDYALKLKWYGGAVDKGLSSLESRINSIALKAKQLENIKIKVTHQATGRGGYGGGGRNTGGGRASVIGGQYSSLPNYENLEKNRIQYATALQSKLIDLDNIEKKLAGNNSRAAMAIREKAASNREAMQSWIAEYKKGSIRSLQMRNQMVSDFGKIRIGLKTTKAEAVALNQQFNLFGNLGKRIGSTYLAMAASTAGAYATLGAIAGSFNAAKQFEQMDVAMTAAFGSQQIATQEMEYATSVANKYKLDIFAAGEGWSKIAYAAKMSNMPIDQARQMFEDLSISSRAFGLSADDTKGAMRAVIQMMGKGKVNAEDLRQQLAERLPAAIPLLAKSMGITISELEDQMKAGAVPAEKLVGMFKLMASDVKASGAFNKSLKSMGAAQTALANSAKMASKAFWGENAKGGFKDFMFMLTNFLERNNALFKKLGNNFAVIGGGILSILEPIGEVLATVTDGYMLLIGELTSSKNITAESFVGLNTFNKLLLQVKGHISDIPRAYIDMMRILRGEDLASAGSISVLESQKMADYRGIPIDEQIGWEIKYGREMKELLGMMQNKEISTLDFLNPYTAYPQLAKMAEARSAFRENTGISPDAYSRNLMTIGSSIAPQVKQGKINISFDKIDLVKLSTTDKTELAVPYTIDYAGVNNQ